MNILDELQNWYAQNCDKEWEEEYGIRIETLDNPGWAVFVDLSWTKMEPIEFSDFSKERSENNWVVCRVRNKKFEGFGGPYNLIEILEAFLIWKQENS